jgi:phospholipid/cholesterol/gamma-HCH transport system permease protein
MADQVTTPSQPVAQAPDTPLEEMPLVSTPLGTISKLLAFMGETMLLMLQAFGALLSGKVSWKDILEQMVDIGTDSLGIVLAITTSTGIVFSYYTVSISLSIGVTDFIGGMLGYVFLNELGPTLTGAAVAARAGAAIAAQIGSMVVTEQVDALKAMAVPPIRYLVAPRIAAGILMMPILTMLADIVGLYGAYVLARINHVPRGAFMNSVYNFVGPDDLIHGIIKSFVFGAIITTVACHEGLHTTGGAVGVGRATTRSVVSCMVLVFISNFVMTQILTHVSAPIR